MAVENLKATAITNADATPVVFSNASLAKGRVQNAVGTLEAANAASVGSTYRLARVPSNARVSQVLLSNDAFTTTGAGDVGLYKTNGGAVVDADFFASAVALTAAQSNVDVTHESGVFGIEDAEQMLWQALGLTADPQIEYDVAITLTTANGAGGPHTVTLKVEYAI